MWREFKHQFQSSKYAMALGVGDYGDWLRPSMRERLNATLTKDDSARLQLDSIIRKDHDTIIDEMEFLKGKIIGLHEGHHVWKFMSGDTTDQRLASALKAPFLGWTASTRLVLYSYGGRHVIGDEGAHCNVYTMISTHGNANGRKVGSALNWLENNIVEGFNANQYIMGHGCKNANFVPHAIDFVRRSGPPGLNRQIPRCLIVGGFSEGYTNGWDYSYVEKAGFAPQPLGWGIIRLKIGCSVKASIAAGLTNRESKTISVEQINVTPNWSKTDAS